MIQRFAHILIVDDDADVCGIICAMLEEMNYRVSTASDAAEARRILQAESVDLLVTDHLMFGENGNILADHAASLGVPALLISGNYRSIEQLEGGSYLFLKKPFHFEELQHKVTEALGKPRGDPDGS